jgi:hypothetical protein
MCRRMSSQNCYAAPDRYHRAIHLILQYALTEGPSRRLRDRCQTQVEMSALQPSRNVRLGPSIKQGAVPVRALCGGGRLAVRRDGGRATHLRELADVRPTLERASTVRGRSIARPRLVCCADLSSGRKPRVGGTPLIGPTRLQIGVGVGVSGSLAYGHNPAGDLIVSVSATYGPGLGLSVSKYDSVTGSFGRLIGIYH